VFGPSSAGHGAGGEPGRRESVRPPGRRESVRPPGRRESVRPAV